MSSKNVVIARIKELTDIAKKINLDDNQNNRTKSDAYVELSEYLFSFGAYKSAAYYFEMAFKVRRDYVYDSLNAKICIMAGLCQIRSGSLIQAERFFGYGLAAAKQSDSQEYVSICCANLALIYQLQGHVDEAIKWGKNALTEASSCYDMKSEEYLDVVRANLSVMIQSAHYKEAVELIADNNFNVIEGSLLSAGCHMALGELDTARSLLIVAHGQYHSDLRIKESRTPATTLTAASEGILETFEEAEEDAGAAGDSEGEKWFDGGGGMNKVVDAEIYEKEQFGEEVFSNWDYAKQKEYSCRNQVMPALVNYNLSVLFGKKGDFVKQKRHLSEAVDIMHHVMKRLNSDTASVVVLQASEGVIKETVLPTVDTLLSSYLAHSHFQSALSEDLFLHGSLLSSLKIQTGAVIETDATKTDEHAFLKFVLQELNSSISSWSEDYQLQNMLHIIKNNVATKEKRRLEDKDDVGGDPQMMKLKNMKTKLKNLSKRSKLTQSSSDLSGGDDKVTATNALEIEKAQKEKEEKKRKEDLEAKTIEETMDCSNPDVQLAAISVASVLHIANFNVTDEEKKVTPDESIVTDNYHSLELSAMKNITDKASKAKKTSKTDSGIATHGSVKQEMMPTCHPSHVEGVTEADAEISRAMSLCEGLGYGAMCMSGGAEWEDPSTKSNRRAEPGSKALKAHHEALTAAKKRLQALEASLVPKKSERAAQNARGAGHQGTLLALYSALSVLCSQLASKKEAGLYINRFVNLTEKLAHPHYQAIGCRMSLDYEEWQQSSSATFFSAKPTTRLKKLQAVLLNTKRFFGFASQCREIDPELYFDAHKRLVNVYCDISSLPRERVENAEEEDTDNTAANTQVLSMLSQEDIDDCEATDIDWLREYAAVRARQCQTVMSAELKTALAESVNNLNNAGVDLGGIHTS